MFRTDQFVGDGVILREQSLSGSRNVTLPPQDPSFPIKCSPIFTEAQLRGCVLDTHSPPQAWGALMLTDFSGIE